MTKDTNRYCNCMEEIKLRAALIHKIVHKRISLGSELFDGEIVCLQIRKILELIALSSLVANKVKYAAAHEKFQSHWRANKILEALEKINTNFYPQPVKIFPKGKIGENTAWHLEHIKDEFLTKEDFIKLFNLCSDVLHVRNPYDSREGKIDFGISIDEWLKKIGLLLEVHTIQFADSKDYWLIRMVDTDKKAHAYTLEHVENPDISLESQKIFDTAPA